jgi:hypothetical protein
VTVTVLADGAPVEAAVTLRVSAADAYNVEVVQTTVSGIAVFENVPNAPVLLEAVALDGTGVGTAGVTPSVEPTASINLILPRSPGQVSNNDFSQGLDGWHVTPPSGVTGPTATIQTHVE